MQEAEAAGFKEGKPCLGIQCLGFRSSDRLQSSDGETFNLGDIRWSEEILHSLEPSSPYAIVKVQRDSMSLWWCRCFQSAGPSTGFIRVFRVQLPKCHPSWNRDRGPMKTSPFPIYFLAPKWEFACVQRTWSFMCSIFLRFSKVLRLEQNINGDALNNFPTSDMLFLARTIELLTSAFFLCKAQTSMESH